MTNEGKTSYKEHTEIIENAYISSNVEGQRGE